jgi:Transposase and inactivated derivatives, IS30 family
MGIKRTEVRYPTRVAISELYNQGRRVYEIAEEVGYSPTTLYFELKRGSTDEPDMNGRCGYDPEKAEARYRAKQLQRGTSGKKIRAAESRGDKNGEI